MSSKENILSRIKKIGLEVAELPSIPNFEIANDIVSQFKESLEANHVTVLDNLKSLESELTQYEKIVSLVPQVSSTMTDAELENRSNLNQVEAVITEGMVGVSENGAIWIPEANMKMRSLPFITLHFIVVIKKESIVGNMHQGYGRIKDIPGFGLFVAGPSKTADIEQSLVVGAHGPKKMTVLIID